MALMVGISLHDFVSNSFQYCATAWTTWAQNIFVMFVPNAYIYIIAQAPVQSTEMGVAVKCLYWTYAIHLFLFTSNLNF